MLIFGMFLHNAVHFYLYEICCCGSLVNAFQKKFGHNTFLVMHPYFTTSIWWLMSRDIVVFLLYNFFNDGAIFAGILQIYA